MKYFGTDGIRGKVGVEITCDLALKLGKSLAVLNFDTVVIGTDTRESKDLIATSVAAGAMSVGINVIFASVIPTPALIYYTKIKNILGVMITASHNPYYDNGLKVIKNGVKLSQKEEEMIEERIDFPTNITSSNFGKIVNCNDIESLYLTFLNNLNFTTNKKVTIDTANGATSKTASLAFSKVTPNLEIIAHNPNGVNINENVGSTHIDNLINKMKENGSDIGFSFDGDGDRIIAVDKNLSVFDGDLIIYIIAKYLYSKNQLNDNTVVFTKMSNLGILNALHKVGIKTVLTDVGDKYVTRELVKNNYSIGGENSGHIILSNILPTGDGTLIGLMLLKIIEETNKTLKDLISDVQMYADKLVNLKVKNKDKLNDQLIVNRVKQINDLFKDNGKVILRASGTEDLVRLSVMAETMEIVEEYINELSKLVLDICN